MQPNRYVVAGLMAALVGLTAAVGVHAQEPRKVDKNSVRVNVPGCSRGYMFTATRPGEDAPGGAAVPEGTRLRMNGKKALMNEIKGHEGSRIEITGLIRKGQELQPGVPIGGGARISGGPMPGGGGGVGIGIGRIGTNPIMIDVEGWRTIPGDCPR